MVCFEQGSALDDIGYMLTEDEEALQQVLDFTPTDSDPSLELSIGSGENCTLCTNSLRIN